MTSDERMDSGLTNCEYRVRLLYDYYQYVLSFISGANHFRGKFGTSLATTCSTSNRRLRGFVPRRKKSENTRLQGTDSCYPGLVRLLLVNGQFLFIGRPEDGPLKDNSRRHSSSHHDSLAPCIPRV